eukprot:CAMPEP_0203759892 /NCGR_PEP_ID=MMETSP0098-20131031/13213_1 /ASSEMBLY_ACC=CAM_ASM_000208 /TAXON_ID=96639 /ORGANISM=" , Strain NY0313808BC1" /LENGTH=225 /DNA_ID=CAMNT_0050653197 /DNA_START=93 /DNA_END=767 /DNA_ORIENTATION=-
MKQYFDAPLVVQQLQFSGVFETIDIRQGGFPFRLSHKQFAYQFSCININHKYTEYEGDSKWRNRCAEILNVCKEDFSEDVTIGETLVLYRVSVHKPLMLQRNLAIEVTLPAVQAFIRGAMGRYYATRIRQAQNTLKQALECGNDIAMVRRGFVEVEGVVNEFQACMTFHPGYPMHLFEAGKVLEGNLMKWEDLQQEMEGLVGGKTPNTIDQHLYKLLVEACARAD